VAPTACTGVVSRTRWSLEGAQAAVGWWERSVQCGICSMVVVQEGASTSHREFESSRADRLQLSRSSMNAASGQAAASQLLRVARRRERASSLLSGSVSRPPPPPASPPGREAPPRSACSPARPAHPRPPAPVPSPQPQNSSMIDFPQVTIGRGHREPLNKAHTPTVFTSVQSLAWVSDKRLSPERLRRARRGRPRISPSGGACAPWRFA
jgi:hypothetical protein